MITTHMSDQDQNRELFDRWMYGVNTCIPGIIQEFYPATQTATVKAAIQNQINGYDGSVTYDDPPALLGVPVCFPFAVGAGYAMTWPIQAGDPCVLVFSQRGIDNWHTKGGIQPPEDSVLNRHHDINDAFVMIGAPALTQVISDWLTTGMELRNLDRSKRITLQDKSLELIYGTNSVTVSDKISVAGNMETTKNLSVGTGDSGTFVDALGKMIVVQNGIIVSGLSMSNMAGYINNLTDQVASIDTCADLSSFKIDKEAKLQSLLDGMNSQLEDLTASSVPPVDLITTINWIKVQVEIVKTQMVAVSEEITAVTSGLAQLSPVIANKAQTLGCDWAPPVEPPV